MGPLAAFLISAGIKTGGEIIGGMLPKAKLPDVPFDAMSAEYAYELRGLTEEQREQSQAAFKLEAQRAGIASSGTYLEGMAEIESRLGEVFGREMSKYQIGQGRTKTQWSQQQAMFGAQQEATQGWGARIGRITGYWSGAPLVAYEQTKEKEVSGKLQPIYDAIKENSSSTELLDFFIKYLLGNKERDMRMPAEMGEVLESPYGGESYEAPDFLGT